MNHQIYQIRRSGTPILIGVLFWLAWLKLDGTGLDGVYSTCQGNPSIFQKATYYANGFSLEFP